MWSVLSIIEFLAFFLIYATVSWLNKCKSVMLIVLIIHQGYSYEFPWWECYTNQGRRKIAPPPPPILQIMILKLSPPRCVISKESLQQKWIDELWFRKQLKLPLNSWAPGRRPVWLSLSVGLFVSSSCTQVALIVLLLNNTSDMNNVMDTIIRK
jgi:hypothetical protein